MKFGFLTISAVLAINSALAAPIYDLKVSKSEAREVALGLIEEARGRGLDPQAIASLVKLVRSYRTQNSRAGMSIAEAPFLTFVLNSKIGEIWDGLYGKTHDESLAGLLKAIPLDSIYDGFMQMIVDEKTPPELAATAKQIGKKLAAKILRASGDPKCALDLTDKIPKKPSTVKLIWIKLTAGNKLSSACDARKTIFASAKQQLMDARTNPTVVESAKAQFELQFPKAFRDGRMTADGFQPGFIDSLAAQVKDFPKIVAKKFGGADDQFWGSHTALIESEDARPDEIAIGDFARGLLADLDVASVLAGSQDPAQRGMAAPLFYASANRLLVLTGGNEAVMKDGKFVVANAYDPANPKAVPVLASQPFGGWSVASSPGGPVMTNWDWGTYDPTKSVGPSPLQIFPSAVTMFPRAVPKLPPGATPYESLSDMADLLSSFTEFLKVTRPGSPFAKHFGDASSMDKIIDPASPVLFPREGRMVAVGALAGALKNLIADKVGHLQQVDPATSGSLGLMFHDQVALMGRDDSGASIRGISKVLIAAAGLRAVLPGDPDVPVELSQYFPMIDQALQVGAVILSSDKGQAPDGGFYERFGAPMTTGRSLETAALGMRALTRAYDSSQGLLILRLSLRMGWQFLDKMWGSGAIPQLIEGAGTQPVSPRVVWSLLKLWNETSTTVRADLASEIDWARWDARFTVLRAKVRDQLATDAGPQPM